MPSSAIRPFRHHHNLSLETDLCAHPDRVPDSAQEQPYDCSPSLEDGFSPVSTTPPPKSLNDLATISYSCVDNDVDSPHERIPLFFSNERRWAWRVPSLRYLLSARRTRAQKGRIREKGILHKSHRTTPLRRVFRLLGIALMLLGILEFIALASGLLTTFFPEEQETPIDKPAGRLSPELGQWPTDFSADISPVACHSHNDYWRKEPLFSALDAGCTGVEADVWLFDEDLFVGHSTQSLSPKRTLRTLYIDPLVQILHSQNPLTSFHPLEGSPRSGVFDTKPSQTLVLLIDFKNDGDAIWPYVSEQLQPLRENKYLTYFNGTDVVEGPITIVVTGNAPFKAVVANPHYRDIFFDAPLALMDKISEMTSSGDQAISDDAPTDEVRGTISNKRSDPNQGQGLSGSAPTNPAIYSLANSYYASVDFGSSIGFPWRGHLTSKQKEKIRQQIAGAHSRGLKVRYWGVPSWPRGLRNYLWRVLVREGVDYLNVDDLHSATTGNWGWGDKGPWWSGPWRFWPSTT